MSLYALTEKSAAKFKALTAEGDGDNLRALVQSAGTLVFATVTDAAVDGWYPCDLKRKLNDGSDVDIGTGEVQAFDGRDLHEGEEYPALRTGNGPTQPRFYALTFTTDLVLEFVSNIDFAISGCTAVLTVTYATVHIGPEPRGETTYRQEVFTEEIPTICKEVLKDVTASSSCVGNVPVITLTKTFETLRVLDCGECEDE